MLIVFGEAATVTALFPGHRCAAREWMFWPDGRSKAVQEAHSAAITKERSI
jgi:hypothetical protein